MVKGRDQAFDHFDTNTLKLVEAPSLILAVSFINGTAYGSPLSRLCEKSLS